MEYLCIDVGGSGMKYAIIDDQFQILDLNKIDASFKSRDEFVQTIYKIYNECHVTLSGIAISYCGELNEKEGYVINGGSYPFNSDFYMKEELENICKIPVSIENDGNCAAIAEMNKGVLKDVDNAIVLVLGTGVGSSLVINKTIYRGSHHFSGGMTFSLFDLEKGFSWKNTTTCYCGVGYLLRKFEKVKGLEKNSVNGYTFFEKANTSDFDALNILQGYAKNLASLIFNNQVLLDVDTVAIGGGISCQPLLKLMIEEEVTRMFNKFPVPFTKPKIEICRYYNDANLIGALLSHLSLIE